MENKEKQNNLPWIIVGVVAVLFIIFLVSSSNKGTPDQLNNAPTTQDTNTSQIPVVTPAPQSNQNIKNNNVVSTEKLQACAQQANTNFKNIVALETKNAADLKEIKSFTNHINSKDGKCYMVTTNISNDIGTNLKRLYDVYDNKELAYDLKTTNFNDPSKSADLCFIMGGGDCTITHIFEEKMESTIY